MKTTLPIASALALCVGTAAADVVAGGNVRAGQATAVGGQLDGRPATALMGGELGLTTEMEWTPPLLPR